MKRLIMTTKGKTMLEKSALYPSTPKDMRKLLIELTNAGKLMIGWHNPSKVFDIEGDIKNARALARKGTIFSKTAKFSSVSLTLNFAS